MGKGKKKSTRFSPLVLTSNPPLTSSTPPPPLLPLPPPQTPSHSIPPVWSIERDSPSTIPASGKLDMGLGSTVPQLQTVSTLSPLESTQSEPKNLEESSSAHIYGLSNLEKKISNPVEQSSLPHIHSSPGACPRQIPIPKTSATTSNVSDHPPLSKLGGVEIPEQVPSVKGTTPRVDSQKTVSKPSWVDCVKGTTGKMKKKGNSFVLDSGELCVQIPNEVITKNSKRWENFILGQFHGKIPPPGALHAIFNGIWSNKARDITASKLGARTILIRIPNGETRKRVLNQGIWHIEGQTMFVAKWEPGLNPTMPELSEIPVWLEFRGVPPHFFSVEGFEHIAGLLGEPLHCHQTTVNMTNMEVGRVFTVINPLKPLPEAVNIQFDSGEIHRILVSSPWLPPICDYCSEVGHSLRRCPTAPITCSKCDSTSHGPEMCTKAAYRPRAKSTRGQSRQRVDEPPEKVTIVDEHQAGATSTRGHLQTEKTCLPGNEVAPVVETTEIVLQVTKPDSAPSLLVTETEIAASLPVIDRTSAPPLLVPDTVRATSPPLRTYQRSKTGKKMAKKMNRKKEIESDEDKSDTSVSPASTDFTSDDVSDTGDESITGFTRVMSKKDRRIERNYQGTRPKSNRRVG